MEEFKKISEITANDVAEYLRLTELTSEDTSFLQQLMQIAKTYIMSYTGRGDKDLDKYSDFTIVYLVLIQDMYDNRSLYVDNKRGGVNTVVSTILDMHSVNLL